MLSHDSPYNVNFERNNIVVTITDGTCKLDDTLNTGQFMQIDLDMRDLLSYEILPELSNICTWGCVGMHDVHSEPPLVLHLPTS